ncbi:DNA-binding response regulator [Comamonadaceae bacterium OH2545_COT-014]|nr:DNA-binding response regulator [Comamonadaceae bacterium OH2545_COT-014]
MSLTDTAPLPETVHVVDDDDAFRRSLLFLLDSMGWAAQGHASAAEFLQTCTGSDAAEAIGCLLLDIRMPGMSGLELQATLAARGCTAPIIFITGHGDVELAVQAMKQGAFDFLEKPFRDQRLLDAVSAALRERAARRQSQARQAEAADALARLSPREAEVARLLALGQPNKRVAQALGISEKTVHIHRQHVMEKMDIASAAELVRVMLRADPSALDE